MEVFTTIEGLKLTILGCCALTVVELFGMKTSHKRKPVLYSLIDIGYLVSCMATCALLAGEAYQLTLEGITWILWTPSQHFELFLLIAFCVVTAFMGVISFVRRLTGEPMPGAVCCIHGLIMAVQVGDLLDATSTNYSEKYGDSVSEYYLANKAVIMTCCSFAALGNFLSSGFVYIPTAKEMALKAGRQRDMDHYSSFAKAVLFPVFRHLKNTILTSKIMAVHIPRLNRRLRCYLSTETDSLSFIAKNPNLNSYLQFYWMVLKYGWKEHLWSNATTLFYYSSFLIRIPLFQGLIGNSTEASFNQSILLLAASCVIECLVCTTQSYFLVLNNMRAQLLLQTAIFKKVTCLSASAIADNPAGLVSQLLVADSWVVAVSTYYLPNAFVGAICAPIALAALASHIGFAPALACLAWLLVIVAASLGIEPFLYKCCDVLYRYRDERLKKFTDFLSSVRHIKMSALEDVFQDNLRQLRIKEIDQAYRVNTLESFLETLISASSSVMIIIAFGTVTIMRSDATLNPGTVFACVYILTLMDIFTSYLPHVIRLKTPVSRSCRRLFAFFRAEEHCEMEAQKPDLDKTADGQVTLKGCAFSWTKKDAQTATAVLHDVDLDIQAGSLIAVIGSVGSGKSSLLSAITGNMRCLRGCLHLKGNIGIMPQAAQVLNMTIRDNITFGRPFDCEFYDKVLEACQLVRDIEGFPAGDLTEAGDKGEMLSGGQKQRVALARAVYSRSDIYLLDDPTSAQDPRVARCILEQVIGPNGILNGKTRLIVTNSPRLPFSVDGWVLMHEKGALVFEDLAPLKKHPGAPVALIEEMSAPSALEAPNDGGNNEGGFTEEQKAFKVVKEEGMSWEKGTLQTVLAYFTYSGLDAVLAVLCFVASAVLVACQLLCVRAWAVTMTSEGVDSSTSSPNLIGLLAVFCIGDVVFRLAAGALLAGATRRFSRSLHSEMLRRIAGSPLSFFDATPRARILNRFSMDLEINDTRVFVAYKQLFQNLLCVVTRLSVVGSQAPIVFALAFGAEVVLIFVMRYVARASTIGRLYESTRASRVLHHLMETLDCVGLIRCYGVVSQFSARFRRLFNECLEAFNVFALCFAFARLLVTVCGVFVVILTVLIVIVPGHGDSAASTGLSLLSSLTVPFAMSGAFVVVFWSIQGGVAFERALEYTELPMEQQTFTESRSSADSLPEKSTVFFAEPYDDCWPSKGLVKFDSFSASYCPGIVEDALKNISFEAGPGEKVAVVGRTGAGKSTLVLALLRMIQRTSGVLTIDGTDICTVPLKKLRAAISIIPQDPSLVSGTLRENLDPRGCHSDLQLWTVLRYVHFNDYVESIPEGLSFFIGDKGGNLSAGQRQLVSLARALLRDTKIIVLDEATSQMDQETDRKVQRVLRESFSRCTLITIAHRIDTVLDYNKVVVMGDGRVLECGCIEHLLAKPESTFYSMVRSAGINPELKFTQSEDAKNHS